MAQALWEQIFASKEWGKYPPEHLIRFIARNFYNAADRSKIHILELGLGTGANLWFCAREGFKVSGIEYSKSGIERFKKRMQDENLSAQIEQIAQGDYLNELDQFKNDHFDAIIDVASLCCNDREKSAQIIKKAIDKLKIGGKFYSTAISENIDGFDKSKGEYQEPERGIYTHVGTLRFDTFESIKALFSRDKRLKITACYKQSIETQEGLTVDEILIIEGEKCEN